MNAVTPRQKQILDWVIAFRGKNGYSPSIREIGNYFGISSLRGVTVHLEALERKGLLTLNPGVPRGIVPTKIGEDVPVPTPGFFRIVSGGTPRETKVFSPSGEDVSGAVLDISFGIDRGGVVAKITVYARAEVLVPKGSVEIVEKMIAETVANIGNDKVG